MTKNVMTDTGRESFDQPHLLSATFHFRNSSQHYSSVWQNFTGQTHFFNTSGVKIYGRGLVEPSPKPRGQNLADLSTPNFLEGKIMKRKLNSNLRSRQPHQFKFSNTHSLTPLTGFRMGRAICRRSAWKQFAGVEQFTTNQLTSCNCWISNLSFSTCKRINTIYTYQMIRVYIAPFAQRQHNLFSTILPVKLKN